MYRQKIRWMVVLLAFLLGGIAFGQVTTGTILGTVSDPTGAVVPGATVTIRNVETGITRTASTDAAGRYRTSQLGLGNYEVTAEASGFQSVVRSGITLTVGREAVVDFALQVGAVAEKITVTGEAPLVETTNATVAALVDEGTMRDLPLLGRSFADLTTIQPGVVSDAPINVEGTQAVYSGGGSAARRSVGGMKPQQSNYLLDGMEISTPSEGMPVSSVLGQQLGVDSIREFSLLQNNFGAQFGRAAGGVVNAVTRSGTNEFHGGAFEFLRNDKVDARDYFLDPSLPKAPLRRNQFGAFVGGPIQKDRTFFFANYEGLRQSTASSDFRGVMSLETRQGRITDGTGKVFRTVKVSEDIKPFIAAIPLPNGNPRGTGTTDRSSTPPWSASENYGIVRIDQQISNNDSLFGRLTIDRSSRTDQYETILPGGYIGYQVGGYLLAAVSETHVFSPTVLNTFRMGFTRRHDNLFYNYSDGGEFFPQGHPNLDPRFSPVKGVPLGLFSVPGSGYGGYGPSLSGPAVFVDNTFDYDDSVIVNRGRHSLTFGGNIKWYRMNTKNEPWVYGNFSWQTLEDFLQNNPLTTTQLIGSHVPGLQKADVYRGWRQTYGALYVQDDLKLLPNLTLNLGVRWEKIGSPREVNGKLGELKNLYQSPAFTLLGKDDPLFAIRYAVKGLSPRVGFAWTPFADQTTVLRGGFGLFPELIMEYVYQLALEAPPYSTRFTVNRPTLKFPYPFSNPSLVSAAGEPLLMAPDSKTPYSMQWTLSLERQLSNTLVVKANYLGSRGVDLFAVDNPNQPPTVIKDGRQYTEATSKAPNPNFTAFRFVTNVANQWYQSGQLVMEKRFSSGLRFNTSYTLSKNLDTGGGAGTKGAEQVSGATSFNVYNIYDLAHEKGLTSFHTKHNYILSATYELPFGSGQRWGSQWRGVVDRLLGGWVVSGTSSWRSGLPTNISGFSRRARCVAQSCQERLDLKPGGNNNPVLENWTIDQYFDYTQFALQPEGFFGNMARNTLIRPGVLNLNVSFTKDNRLGEGKNLEFRAELFNFPNHPNFGNPSTSIFRTAAGELNSNIGRITSLSTSMRQIQFGLKLTF